MSSGTPPDWDPRSEAVQADQRAAYDEMRERCPVAYSDFLGWSLFRHQDVLRVLNDPDTFSSVVSAHPAVPNGMDPPEHTGYRRIIDSYFGPDRIEAFEPQCRDIAVGLVRSLLERGEAEFIGDFGDLFAVQVQCAFMGWPADMRAPMQQWVKKNFRSRFARDRTATNELAREFEGHVLELLRVRREAGPQASDDVTTRLMREQLQGRPLRDDEIVSIVRNWTVGEVGTISASVAILADHFSQHTDLQQRLRARPSLLPDVIEEILRIHGPLVDNRRTARRAVEIAGRQIAAGDRVCVNWIAANRDSRVFEDAQAFRLGRDAAPNLLYGAGIHVCPGAPLARMELRVAAEELLARTSRIEPIPDRPPTCARYPAGGLATLFLRIR